MTKIHKAPFAQTPKTGSAVVTTAVATLATDTPTNTSLIGTAGLDGALLTSLVAVPRATVTATALYFFIRKSTDAAGVRRLIHTELMAAHTVATTTKVPETVFDFITEATPFRLEAGDEIYVGAGVALAGGINFVAQWTDF
jgi:hypothetical protein